MSTLLLHAPHASQVRLGFARVSAAIVTVLDVFAEAQLRALAAHKRLSVH
jgi:hypothetical protein